MRKNKTTHIVAGILLPLFVIAFIVLTGRFMYIQATGVVDGVSLDEWAKQKRTSSYPLHAERGKIYDNNGMTLAYDRPIFRMYAIVDKKHSEKSDTPRHVTNPEKTAESIAKVLEVETDDILTPLQNGIENERFQVEFGSIANELSQQQRDEILELKLPGINFEKDSIRYYPNGMFASHIIGFARETEVQNEEGIKNEITGIAGIENEMNDILGGKNGFISYQRDKYNNRLLNPNEIIQEPENGNDVYLTLDQKIQTLVEDVLTEVDEEYNPKRLTAVVMNPKTGEVLAMSSRPSYNPNNPANVENWYNDAVSTPFEPGSTMKMFTWAAAIEEGVYNGSEGFQSGSYRVNEKIVPIHDHNNGKGWGTISYDEGFERSSNVAAAKLVWEKLGADKYLEYLHAFDFDKKTGIDLPGEVAGHILYNWPLEKITTSFGQGTTLTPIQQMKAATAIANNGKMLQPYVIQKIVDSTSGDIIEEKSPNVVGEPISKETAKQVLSLLEATVTSEDGTSGRYELQDYSVGGKSGTAQIPNPKGGYLTGKENYIFSFLGMAPIDNPQLMMYVSVQQPELEATETGSMPVSFIFTNVMENALHYLNIDPDKDSEDTVNLVEIPTLKNQKATDIAKNLTDQGATVTTIGNGSKIVSSNVQEGDKVLPQERIMLVTDKPTMPNIIGWSVRDTLELAGLLKLQTEILGNGFAVTQNIKEGTPIKENDYLGIEFKIPTIQDEKPTDTTENPEDENGNE
ncbi:penicillin-binding protein [Oceanobacillus chungangensis]|uniref:serine-type D-Ala-D-Ala carboxypeptidase n=1 Tax=Oceanobacillus chungangensis TaxID=1229152 RepID=A0A3D8PP92_9BACI|nr:penicillin-binding protein [Oceanobacillus chungangensis]RDW17930.1 penicillin-binding protein [Oceanobacillus chungangensis]